MKITNQTEPRTNRNLYTVEAMLLRYGLALIFLWIGGMKFTAYDMRLRGFGRWPKTAP